MNPLDELRKQLGDKATETTEDTRDYDRDIKLFEVFDAFSEAHPHLRDVVLCGECRHWDEAGWCHEHENDMGPDDFCSRGQRKPDLTKSQVRRINEQKGGA